VSRSASKPCTCTRLWVASVRLTWEICFGTLARARAVKTRYSALPVAVGCGGVETEGQSHPTLLADGGFLQGAREGGDVFIIVSRHVGSPRPSATPETVRGVSMHK
jgi:hypothetical protein